MHSIYCKNMFVINFRLLCDLIILEKKYSCRRFIYLIYKNIGEQETRRLLL